MRSLVTGCAGFIGSHLTESLLEDGWTVVGVDCFNDNYARPQKLRNLDRSKQWEDFDFVPIDLARGDLGDLVADCDVVFHLAAEPGVRPSWGQRFEAYLRNNVQATQHLLEAMTDWPGKRFVYASSSSIYGDSERFPTPEDTAPRPLSPYGVTKLSAEHLCQAYNVNFGVETVTLRYFSVYGPRQRPDMAFNRFCRAALEGGEISVFGDGRQTRDFTFVRDVVTATRAASAAPAAVGGTFNVGGGSQVSVNAALELIGAFAERPLDIRYGERQHGDVRDTSADISRTREGLGYEPTVSFEEGLRSEFDWMAAELSAAVQLSSPSSASSSQT